MLLGLLVVVVVVVVIAVLTSTRIIKSAVTGQAPVTLDPYRLSSRFYSFALFLEAVGVRVYGCMAVESRMEAQCFATSPR